MYKLHSNTLNVVHSTSKFGIGCLFNVCLSMKVKMKFWKKETSEIIQSSKKVKIKLKYIKNLLQEVEECEKKQQFACAVQKGREATLQIANIVVYENISKDLLLFLKKYSLQYVDKLKDLEISKYQQDLANFDLQPHHIKTKAMRLFAEKNTNKTALIQYHNLVTETKYWLDLLDKNECSFDKKKMLAFLEKKLKQNQIYALEDASKLEECVTTYIAWKKGENNTHIDFWKAMTTLLINWTEPDNERVETYGLLTLADLEEEEAAKAEPKNSQCLKKDCSENEDKQEEEDIRQSFLACRYVGTEIGFNDIIGHTNVKRILKEGLIEAPIFEILNKMRIRQEPKGILLYGPSGTGKTMIAKALSHELKNRPFFIVTPSEIANKWKGGNTKRLKILFDVLAENSPCILFLDEAEAILQSRRKSPDNSGDVNAANKLLTLMDDLEKKKIFAIAATNFPDKIDNAFLRRFTSQIHVPLPSEEEREQIIKMYIKPIPHCLSDEDFKLIAEKTNLYSPSDLKQIALKAGNAAWQKTIESTHFKLCRLRAGFFEACNKFEDHSIEMGHIQVPFGRLFPIDVTISDVLTAITLQKPTAQKHRVKQLQHWKPEDQ